MKYLHVANMSYKKNLAYDQAILRQSGDCLYSLIEGLRQKDFGLHTLDRVQQSIEDYRKACVMPVGGRLFTDSGGYSIISGQVHPADIPRFIECYDHFLANERDAYDYIFSLDIPLSLRFEAFNTKDNIRQFNKTSLEHAKNFMEAFPEIRDKYYFVWQFKLQEQYEIWKQLYGELGLDQVVKNYAVGGMVGLRRLVKINYSPFIPMAYKCLSDFMAGDRDGEFRLHFLGMYIKYDRFLIALLERLFERYLGGKHPVRMSYDSVNPVQAVRMNKSLNTFVWDGNEMVVYPRPGDVSEAILRRVYHTPELFNRVMAAVAARGRGERLENTNAFAPLNIYSNKCLDVFFEATIDQTCLVEMFLEEKHPGRVMHNAKIVMNALAENHPQIFDRAMVKSTLDNLERTFRFHHWFMNDRRPGKLDELIVDWIKTLNVPFKLT